MTEYDEPSVDAANTAGRISDDQAKPANPVGQRVVPISAHGDIVGRARAGEPQQRIAVDYGITQGRVSQIVRAHGGLHATGPTSLDADARSRSLANLKDAPPAPRGNLRHLKHGVRSERVMAPYRARAIEWAEARWPWLDPTRRELVADLAARCQRVVDWSNEGDVLVEVPSGPGSRIKVWQAHPIVSDADKWQSRLWNLIGDLDAEQRERDSAHPQASIDAVLAELAEGDET